MRDGFGYVYGINRCFMLHPNNCLYIDKMQIKFCYTTLGKLSYLCHKFFNLIENAIYVLI